MSEWDHYSQYGSRNNADCYGEVDRGGRGIASSTEQEVAHLSFDAAWIAPSATRLQAFVEDFGEQRVMRCLTPPRGKSGRSLDLSPDDANGMDE